MAIKFSAKRTFIDLEAADLLSKFNLEKGGAVQQVINKCVMDYCQAYTPWDTGTMSQSVYTMSDLSGTEVTWQGPYAHYLYYGEVYGPNFPIFEDNTGVPTAYFSPPKKYPTGRELQYATDINPLAGSYWFERMKADRLDDIVKEAEAVAKGK